MNLEARTDHAAVLQRGMVLITTLLLLIVITILALAMFRGVGLENRIAGNVLDKQRALQAADSAQQYAEQWILNNVMSQIPVDCASNPPGSTVLEICNLPLAQQVAGGSVTTVPWKVGNAYVGYSYQPGQAGTVAISTSGGSNTLYQYPITYIGELGPDLTYANATDYVVDAWSYGGSQSTVAVVESVYRIRRYVASGTNP